MRNKVFVFPRMLISTASRSPNAVRKSVTIRVNNNVFFIARPRVLCEKILL